MARFLSLRSQPEPGWFWLPLALQTPKRPDNRKWHKGEVGARDLEEIPYQYLVRLALFLVPVAPFDPFQWLRKRRNIRSQEASQREPTRSFGNSAKSLSIRDLSEK